MELYRDAHGGVLNLLEQQGVAAHRRFGRNLPFGAILRSIDYVARSTSRARRPDRRNDPVT